MTPEPPNLDKYLASHNPIISDMLIYSLKEDEPSVIPGSLRSKQALKKKPIDFRKIHIDAF
jgi:hypothetical protein